MKDNKIAVMQIIDNLDIGGAQEVVRTMTEYLAMLDCQPVVCTLKDGPLRHEIEIAGVQVEVLPGRHYSVLAFPFFIIDMIRIWRSLVKLVDKYNVDVVQTHLLGALDFMVLLLRYATPVRAVFWTFHNINFEPTVSSLHKHRWLLGPKRFGRRLLYRLTSGLVSGYIAVSDEVKRAMIEIIGPIGDKITVICNGVDTRRYQRTKDKALARSQLGLGTDARLIVSVATLKEQKGHRFLIDAMASIIRRYPDVHALLLGDGPLREELELQVETLHLGGHVHFLGSRNDVPEILAVSDLFVLPSLWEGLAMALLEAMATGLPIVASSVSGTVQVIRSGESGVLVPPGDSNSLKQAIIEVLEKPKLAVEMGAAAKRLVEEQFSAQKQAEEHLNLYRLLT